MEIKKEYRNSQRTKRMIRTAFAELIGEKKVISEITVSELAERADIAKSTFYNHYDDIYAVAEELLRELIVGLDRIVDAMEADSTNDYRVYIKSIFAFLRENEELYRKVADSPDAVFFISRIKHYLSKRAFANIKSPNLSQNKVERYVQIRFYANACVDTMVDYFKGDIDMSFDELERTIMDILDKMM
ncbi:MAG: TetR/AcrR family transcriptional regulator C-terminal domain-containing protein [Clostridia bacterium]|nr:TetR/AcrR family transcriptional regulator C-terminal domain-containing protein [Clostridia bacterium]